MKQNTILEQSTFISCPCIQSCFHQCAYNAGRSEEPPVSDQGISGSQGFESQIHVALSAVGYQWRQLAKQTKSLTDIQVICERKCFQEKLKSSKLSHIFEQADKTLFFSKYCNKLADSCKFEGILCKIYQEIYPKSKILQSFIKNKTLGSFKFVHR